jgi:Tfp pilus assembly protein PilV
MPTRRVPAQQEAAPRPAQPGFTLAELVVALMLLAWGALALVAASASAVRTIGAAATQERATAAARDRLEQIAASRDCLTMRDGDAVDSVNGIRERWTITGRGGTRLVTDSVDYADHGTTKSVALRRLVLC